MTETSGNGLLYKRGGSSHDNLEVILKLDFETGLAKSIRKNPKRFWNTLPKCHYFKLFLLAFLLEKT